MRKWIPLLIVAAAFIATAAVYPDLPDRIPTHWNMQGEVDRWSGRRISGALMMPLIILLLWALMRWLPYIDPRHANYAKFTGAFEEIMIAVMLFMLFIHAMILRAALGYPIPEDRWFPVAFGILFIVVGNLMPRARTNWFLGIRTPWTLSSDRVWDKTQRVGGRLFVIGGLVLAAAGLTGVSRIGWVQNGVVAVCVFGSILYSYIEWRKEKRGSAAPTV